MGKSKRKKHKHSDTSDSSSSSESDDKRAKKKLRELKKKVKKIERKTQKSLRKKLKKEKERLKKERTDSKSEGHSRETSHAHEASADIPLELMGKAKAMAPMTKEEWEQRQSVVKRIKDEETGRYRLIKGDGEVLEEIVSRDRHKEINKRATHADGAFFQLHTSGKPKL